jgi:hypothetical protein
MDVALDALALAWFNLRARWREWWRKPTLLDELNARWARRID